ncbi:MAG TPA: NADH-quinone oxidoreductase subunit C [Polyangiaceae bacterium]|nr:NADH-quinone oxidoreductase subunit C [Polyangiaceae bacterium]
MSGPAWARTRNALALERATIPRLSAADFQRGILDAVACSMRVAALFGIPAQEGRVEIVAVLSDDTESTLHLATTVLSEDSYPSLTPECPQAHLFEREIAEQWGIVPKGHPWLKPVRFVRSRRPGHDAWNRADCAPLEVGVMDYYRVEGEEVHEVAVGPVHAGVIEPGHFRFQCHGEQVFHLEISLGYQHRGVERALVGGPDKRTVHYMETLSGDTTVGHTTAYCHLVEALQAARVPARAHALRGIALELERLANHTGGLGALANDVAFLPTASFCGRLRGDFLNLTAALCGSRFGRGVARPGGVGFDVDEKRAAKMLERLDSAARDLRGSVELLWESASVQARFETTGTVSTGDAEALGLVGVAARACGLERDVRHDHPAGVFRLAHIPVSVWQTGDVFARAYVRWLEMQRSIAFIREQLGELPSGAIGGPLQPLAPHRLGVSLVEGWRGEICHVAVTDEAGRFAAYKVIDPSFHNWSGLAMALRGAQISDFPLCNKSFDLSYCGFDL